MRMFPKGILRISLRITLFLLLPTAALLASCSSAHAISITTTTLPVGQLTGSYSGTIQSTGGSSPYTWSISAGSLPPGLTLNNSGQASTTITGTPTAVGSYNFTVKVKGGSGYSNTKQLSITVDNMAVTVPNTGSANQIYVNGSPGQLFGWTFVGIDDTTGCAGTYYSTPWNNWNWGWSQWNSSGSGAVAELTAAKSAGANTIRFQVAVDELYESNNSNGQWNSIESGYITTITNAIALARSMGLAVIVSMQWESGVSGGNICTGTSSNPGYTGATLHGFPGNGTTSYNGNPYPGYGGTNGTDPAYQAWSALLNSTEWTTTNPTGANFSNDPGVVLEVYNEPNIDANQLQGTSTNWSDWQTAMNDLVATLRSYGANNVLIIPGLKGETVLDATSYNSSGGGESIYQSGTNGWNYMVTDSLNGTNGNNYEIYALHPYPHDYTDGFTIGYFTSTDWNNYFGNVVQTLPAPVMLTEWFTGSANTANCWDTTTQPNGKQPSPTPYGYQSPTNFTSPTITSDLVTWLETAGPGGTPMSMTGTGFDVPNFYLQNLPPTPGGQPPSSYTLTSFSGSFTCGSSTVQGPGQDISGYYLSYPWPY